MTDRHELPHGAVTTATVEVVGFIDPDSGGQAYSVWADCDVPLSTALGLLELAKNDLIERSNDE